MTMLVRIAKGIHASLSSAPSLDADIEWESLPDDARAPYLTAAIRTLTIMRTPTDDMLADGNRRGAPQDAANLWERMIYRALYEKPN